METESEFILGIAEAVADGTPVDWLEAETRVGDAEGTRVLRSLRLVSQISTLHDSLDPADAETLTRTATPGDATAPATAPAAGTETAAPAGLRRWGRYELREQLGAGAQGAVYRAWDPQLECEVALKVMQPRVAAADRLGERMLREGRALAKVRHQNVVNVYAAEVHEGQVGLCMEFIKGRTLEEVLRVQGPFGAGEAVAVGLKVGHALTAVHAAGLVHRDVKARNVMREDGGRIVLMDFGTGRDFATQGAPGGGDLAGTPLYMAPEVLAGAGSSRQSDIYSVGVLLYYLVTGAYPVEGGTLDAIVQAHARGRRKPLAERRPDLPDAFIRILDRATATDPDARYDSAAMLVHDLVALGAEEASRVLPPRTVTQRVILWTAWVVIAAIGVTMLGFLTSMAFNITLERVAIAGETPRSWPIWGLRGLVGPLANIAQILIGVLLLVAVWRGLRRGLPPFDRAAVRLSQGVARLGRRLGWSNVDAFGQVAFVLALAYLVVVLLMHSSLISAMMSTVSNMTGEQRAALSPANRLEHTRYRSLLDVLVLSASLAAFRLARMRRRQPTAISAAVLTALLAVLALAAMMWMAPYRLLFQADRPEMVYGGERCFDLGRDRSLVLLYCPEAPQPKVQRVLDTDARLRDTGITRNVFSAR